MMHRAHPTPLRSDTLRVVSLLGVMGVWEAGPSALRPGHRRKARHVRGARTVPRRRQRGLPCQNDAGLGSPARTPAPLHTCLCFGHVALMFQG